MADPIGATLTLDISDVKRSLTEANKLIKENEANWRINAAAMGDWTKSEEGLNDRMRFLSKTIEQQEKNVEGLVKARDEAIAKYGKESYEVQDLNSKIITQSKNLFSINKIIKDRLDDNQLSESPLTLKDIKIISTKRSDLLIFIITFP